MPGDGGRQCTEERPHNDRERNPPNELRKESEEHKRFEPRLARNHGAVVAHPAGSRGDVHHRGHRQARGVSVRDLYLKKDFLAGHCNAATDAAHYLMTLRHVKLVRNLWTYETYPVS